MPESAHEQLDALAQAVADGRALDWDAVESSARDDSERVYIRKLRAIAAIGRAHAELTFSGETSQSSARLADLPAADANGITTPVAWGSLQLLERVGRGRFGDVYRAWEPSLAREVALKLLRRSDVGSAGVDRTVIEEGRLMARVRHPNVVAIYGAQRIDGRTGLWMEFVEGRTLDAELKERGPLPAEDVIKVGVELCRALSAVHDAGLVHRDVKAQNVMRDRSGRVLLSDFGTGREHEHASDSDIAGTPLCLAPEVLQGAPATRQSDIYSLGVLLYRLATGTYPVSGRSIRELRIAHERRTAVSVAAVRPGLPTALVAAIERALASDPASRFEEAAALQSALEAGAHTEASGSSSRYRLVAIASVILVAVGSTVAVGFWKRPTPTPPLGVATAPTPSAVAPSVAASSEVAPSATPPSTPVVSATPGPADRAAANRSSLPPERVGVAGTAQGYWALAQEHLRRGDIAEARRYAALIPPRDEPDATGPERWQGRLLFEMQASWQALDARSAFKALDEIVRRDPKSSEYFILPMFYVSLGRLKDAARFIDVLPVVSALSSNPPGSLSKDTMLATVLELADDRAPLRNLLLTRPQPVMMDTRMRVLLRAGLVDEADAYLERTKAIFKRAPVESKTSSLYDAQVALARGNPARAVELLAEDPPFKGRPDSSTPLELARLQALAWDALGDTERAIAALLEGDIDRHKAITTSNVGLWLEHRALLARLYRKAGRNDDAAVIEDELRKLLAVADADHPIVRQLGIHVLTDRELSAK